MNKKIKKHTELGKIIKDAWRSLFRFCRTPLRRGNKSIRRKSCGTIGLNSRYLIHSTEFSANTTFDVQVQKLLHESELRYQKGFFFKAMAEQVDRTPGVITGRIQQDEPEAQRIDHIVAVFPKDPT